MENYGQHGELDAGFRRQPCGGQLGFLWRQNGQNLYGYIGTLGTKYTL